MSSARRVAVTGVGMITPVGPTTDETWRGLVEGRSGVVSIPEWVEAAARGQRITATIAGRVTGFEPERWLASRKDVFRMDRFIQLAVAAAHQAWQGSGLPERLEGPESERAASIIGVGFGGVCTLLETNRLLEAAGPDRLSPYAVPATLTNLAAGNIAIRYNLRGPSWALSSACASGAHGIGEAFHLIRDGRSDVAVVGGAEAPIVPLAAASFGAARALCASRNHAPAEASRPFDKARDGFVLGEGAGVLVLEEMGHAERRGARILAEVAGYGSTCDATHVTLPSADGAVRAIRGALAVAGADEGDVGCVVAHGTSTSMSDRIETEALKAALGKHAYRVHVTAPKSMTGHMLGAAGSVQAAIAVLALDREELPPTINYEEPDPACDLDYVPNVARRARVGMALSNCFGFGGTNAVLAFRRPS